MSEKNILSRIVHKHDTEANWNKAVNFIPIQGEIIVYDIDENYNYERVKIGDGTKKVNELPFASVNIDSTLSIEGQAADAKAVGNAFEALGALSTKDSVSKSDLASDIQTSLGKADTALQSYTETDPTVPAWAKAASKPSYTASEVGALPDTTVIPSKTSDLTNDSGYIVSAPVTSVNGMTGDVVIDIPEQIQTDWNQNDETQLDYVNNRTHYDLGNTSTSYTVQLSLSSSCYGIPSGMITGCFIGKVKVASKQIVPYNYNIGSFYGKSYTNLSIGEVVTHRNSGPVFNFCINATYVGGEWNLYFYADSGAMAGTTVTVSNVKTAYQLDKKYLPMDDIVAAVKASYPSAEGASF